MTLMKLDFAAAFDAQFDLLDIWYNDAYFYGIGEKDFNSLLNKHAGYILDNDNQRRDYLEDLESVVWLELIEEILMEADGIFVIHKENNDLTGDVTFIYKVLDI